MAGYVSPFDAGNGGTSSRAGNYKSPFIGDPNVPAPMPVPKVAAPVKQPSFLDHVKNVISGARTAGKYELSGAKSFFNDNPIGQTEKGLVQPFIDAGNGVAKQSAYLFGRTSTPAERQAILDNQNKAQQAIHSGKYNPQTMQAITKSAGKGTVQGMIKTHQLLASGASDQQVQQHIAADQKVKANMDKRALGEGAQLASYGVGGGEAAGLKGLAEQGIKDFVIQGGKKVAVGAGAGALGNTGATLAANPNANKKQLATSAGQGGIFGGALAGLGVVGSKVLGKIFGKGADAHLTDVQAAQPTQKLLGAGEPNTTKIIGPGGTTGLPQGSLRTNTGATVPGTPATPTHIPVNEQEYNQRFNALSKSYDKETAAAQKISAPLKQKIVLDDIHDRHAAALAQLDHEFQNGKPNPDYNPGTPHKMVQTGFQIVDKNAHIPAAVPLTPSSLENTQVHQRIGQIDAIIHSAQINGANRSPAELRQLMRERQQLEDIASGKVSHESVYGNRPDAALQSAIEIAHNNGNTKLEKELASQLSDQGMNPNASLSPSARQALIDRMRAPSSGSKPLVASQLDADLRDMAKAGKINPTIQHAKVAEMHIGSDSLSSGPLDKKTVAQYKADIQSGRPVTPLVVSKDSAGNTFVQDGAHRLQALKELGIDEAPVVEQNGRKAAYTPFNEAQLPAGTKDVFSPLPTVAKGDMKQSILNRNFVVSKYGELKQGVQDAAKGMKSQDIKLLEKIETDRSLSTEEAAKHIDTLAAQAKNPQQFKKVATLMRQAYDTRYAGDTTIGRKVGYRTGYLPHMFDHTDPNTASVLGDRIKFMNGDKPLPGYTKQRTIPTYAEADRLGLKRKNANVLEDFYHAMDGAASEHGSAALVKGLNEAHPGEVQVGGTSNGMNRRLRIAGGDNVLLPTDIAVKYNRRASADAANGLMKVYDKVNGGVKLAELGGGFFHSFTTAGSTLGHQAASGNLFLHPIENLKVMAGTVSQAAHEHNWSMLASDGHTNADGLSTTDRMHLAGVTFRDTASDVGTKGLNDLPVIKQIHQMVFDRQIPESKALIFKQATQHLNANVPADLAKMRDVASAVNNLGGINRSVEGFSPKTAKFLSRVVLATDFTEGKYRTLFNAVTSRGAKGQIARRMVVGKSVLFALPGLAALVMQNKLDPSDPKAVGKAFVNQVINPQIATNWMGAPTKTNPQGSGISLKLPATFISEVSRIIAPALDPLSTDKMKGVKDYATSRVAALPAKAAELATNKDYYGKPIYGSDPKTGLPLGAGKSALNVTGLVAPIPAVQGMKNLTHAQGIGESAANIAGFRASSDPNSTGGQHTKAVNDFFSTRTAVSRARTQTVNQMNDLVRQGKINQAQRIAQQFNDSIPGRVAPFRAKYSSNYNPAWDKDFGTLKISTSGRAMTSRQKALKQSQAVLQ